MTDLFLATRWFTQGRIYSKSKLVQVMAQCRQAASLYPSQCWQRSLSQACVTRPRWLKNMDKPSHKLNAGLLSVGKRYSWYCVDVIFMLSEIMFNNIWIYFFLFQNCTRLIRVRLHQTLYHRLKFKIGLMLLYSRKLCDLGYRAFSCSFTTMLSVFRTGDCLNIFLKQTNVQCLMLSDPLWPRNDAAQWLDG